MAPRLTTRPARENDFSNVGQIGRRTGVTLPPGRLDDNGIEEITGIFSSPRKPSPLRKSIAAADSVDGKDQSITPKQLRSTRRSLPPPRSASPRKSGIGGTARRSRAIDVLGQNKDKQLVHSDPVDGEGRPVLTPSLLASGARRFSPEKTPRKEVLGSKPQTARSTRNQESPLTQSIHDSIEIPSSSVAGNTSVEIQESAPVSGPPGVDQIADDVPAPAVQDDDQVSIAASHEDDDDEPVLPPPFDDEDADETFAPDNRSKTRSREPTVANSRRKRRSDALEQETEADAISSPAAKKAKRISDQNTKTKQKNSSPEVSKPQSQPVKRKGRPPLKSKDTNTNLSTKQQQELDGIIDRVKARPGQNKSLYILKRETPAADNVSHTRSGRISVKPLAYWKNERCVYGGSPGGASLQDGARFPLNSIKEIIRTEESLVNANTKPKKARRGKAKGKKVTNRQLTASNDDREEEESEQDEEQESDEYDDPEAEAWETERGIFRGPVAEWDSHHQEPVDVGAEIDIAYAPASIETREVKDSTFRYAKMISMKFFGCGIVDLPPGGVKKAKNSRRMHMAFFVATGRVTVHVGALGGPDNTFSIGKGGWWQVPRGNQYAIENELERPARIFFSQACEPLVLEDDE